MLVLTRRAGESLRIGGNIRITVLSVSGGQIRIGIEAPAEVRIHREEVYERIAQANREASKLPDDAVEGLGSPGSDPEEEEP